jgi:hypothetical protein
VEPKKWILFDSSVHGRLIRGVVSEDMSIGVFAHSFDPDPQNRIGDTRDEKAHRVRSVRLRMHWIGSGPLTQDTLRKFERRGQVQAINPGLGKRYSGP